MREEMKGFFKCGICGEEYLNASARNKCETNCLKKADEKAKVLKNAEMEKKRKEIDSKIDELKQLVHNYNKEFNKNLIIEIKTNSINIATPYSDYYVTHINEEMDINTIKETIDKAMKNFSIQLNNVR